MPRLLLGPLLRYVSDDEATVWVETDVPCEVEVLGRSEPTWHVSGHHYALIVLRDLEPGRSYEYDVTLDGERVWPDGDPALDGFPPSTICTHGSGEPIRIVFGSCRVAVPHEEPYTRSKDDDERGREVDALYALALRMREQPRERWPDALLLLGDQVYADEDAPATRAFIRARRDISRPPHEEVADFEEYTRLYWESWGDPVIRWLLSTVPSAMIFDDHDVHDDWNTSISWLEEMRAQPWWHERIIGALSSYWIYQHLGNLSPRELDADGMFAKVKEADDGGPALREFAARSDVGSKGRRWSFHRDIGNARIVFLDSREGRVLGEQSRKMLDEDEWEWVEQHARGDVDHLLMASTLPFLIAPAFHHVEAWNEALCDGAWGEWMGAIGEKFRRGLDLEHWAAFRDSFERIAELWRAIGAGERGRPPATIVGLGGDVHHAYLAEVGFRPGQRIESNVYQAVCSPFRNPLDAKERRVVRFATTRIAARAGRALARLAGVPGPPIGWRFVQPPTFDNQFATIELDGREARLTIERTVAGETDDLHGRVIEASLERRLA